MSLVKILQMAQDADTTKDDVVEYIEDIIAIRKSTIKHIITKDDAIA